MTLIILRAIFIALVFILTVPTIINGLMGNKVSATQVILAGLSWGVLYLLFSL